VKPSDKIQKDLDQVEPPRRARLVRLRRAFFAAVDGITESMQYRMPTFTKDGNFVALASQKHYLAVYFCADELIRGIKAKHPELNCGVGCVRIRDTQAVPLKELVASFKKAMRFKQGARARK